MHRKKALLRRCTVQRCGRVTATVAIERKCGTDFDESLANEPVREYGHRLEVSSRNHVPTAVSADLDGSFDRMVTGHEVAIAHCPELGFFPGADVGRVRTTRMEPTA